MTIIKTIISKWWVLLKAIVRHSQLQQTEREWVANPYFVHFKEQNLALAGNEKALQENTPSISMPRLI